VDVSENLKTFSLDSVPSAGTWTVVAAESTFDGFDLIAMDGKNVWLVQIKTNRPPSQKSYILFAKKFAGRYIRVIAMTWYDRKGWVIHTFNKNGTVTKRDLRKTNEKKND
jgi:hypothetical protein